MDSIIDFRNVFTIAVLAGAHFLYKKFKSISLSADHDAHAEYVLTDCADCSDWVPWLTVASRQLRHDS